ncbi:RNA-binding protein, putative [Plasmodium relictum]|uniref:RNA-binding protein, putative n=1 Tax=Plasmodium relictum TaxID=85471 RepID=A0A1J1H921_PLARL|nr:RNA-binding protein, putative [Plasmodium relictum]CRH01133.1 RNA-binding protein, putative [Plasmodium relictum]
MEVEDNKKKESKNISENDDRKRLHKNEEMKRYSKEKRSSSKAKRSRSNSHRIKRNSSDNYSKGKYIKKKRRKDKSSVSSSGSSALSSENSTDNYSSDEYRRKKRKKKRERRYEKSERSEKRKKKKKSSKLNPNLSTSHERSRSRERKRRKLQAECIKRAGGFKKLADMEGHETTNVFWDGFQWVAKTNQSNLFHLDPAVMNSTRKLRRLYFGNLPLHLGLSENAFQEIVWNEMKKRKYCNDENINPVLYVWFAKDKGNYGFVEFATVEETERALTMDGMLCKGVALKVSRPNDYSTNTVKQNQNLLLQNINKQNNNLLNIMNSSNLNNPYCKPPPPPGAPPLSVLKETSESNVVDHSNLSTKYLRVLEIVSKESINEEDYSVILEDIKDGFHSQGIIINAILITHKYAQNTPFDIGDVIIEFENPASVDNSIINMSNRKYEGRVIKMEKCDEHTYNTYVKPIIKDLYEQKL